jgi:hypothetical protein
VYRAGQADRCADDPGQQSEEHDADGRKRAAVAADELP